MKCLYISKYPLFDRNTMNQRIDIFDHNNVRLWTSGIVPPEDFIIKSYEFDKYIFLIDYGDIERLALWDISEKKVDVVIQNCDDQLEALYSIGTDIYLNIEVHFVDKIEDYLKF